MRAEVHAADQDASDGDHQYMPGSVAVLGNRPWIQGVIAEIVRAQGWNYEIVDEARLEQSAHETWSLVVIATLEQEDNLALLVTSAARNPATRVLVIAPHYEPQFVADILRSGADDFLITPFDPKECSARMQSLMTRAGVTADRRKNQLAFDFVMRTVRSGPMQITLPRREWDVLMALLEADGKFLSVTELSSIVWGGLGHRAAAISTVCRVRQRLRDRTFPIICIKTKRGVGYAATFRRSSDTLAR